MIPWLERGTPFPPVERALRHPNGLLAAGADLSADRILAAYRRGIFPWYSEGEPVLWWSPDPRMVLVPAELKISRSLARSLRNRGYALRIDTAFEAVLEGCAAPRRDAAGTWLSPEMRAAYLRLHRLGHAHSFETWRGGELVGGLYGLAIGRMFYGESMFTRATDASKAALAGLARELVLRGFPLIDCQMNTAHLASLGAREMPRADFLRSLGGLVNYAQPPGPWEPSPAGAARPDESPCPG
ncbi:MAG: leucyl/phenylalanyl-tRNA--protein transferase [Betaproteobacteria bacterium]|nr:leucyl/phenylalanyl-tRNA--protein transferase [Betaproteobacteria bacterium]